MVFQYKGGFYLKRQFLKDKGLIVLAELYSEDFVKYSFLLSDEYHDLEYKAKLFLEVLNFTDTCNFSDFLRFSSMYNMLSLCRLEPIIIMFRENTTPIPLDSDLVTPVKSHFKQWKELELSHLEPDKAKSVTISAAFKYFMFLTQTD